MTDFTNRTLFSRVIIIAVCAGLFAAPARADVLAKGDEAYALGKYSDAFEEYLPLALDGNATAQRNIGTLYCDGKGVKQSDEKCIQWYRRAAKQGFALGHFGLGVEYFTGNDVLGQDPVRALAHLMIAAFTAETQGEASVYDMVQIRVIAELSEEEQEEAVEIAGRCMATDFDC